MKREREKDKRMKGKGRSRRRKRRRKRRKGRSEKRSRRSWPPLCLGQRDRTQKFLHIVYKCNSFLNSGVQ